jgi:UDP-N-acetylmuramate dehydrogenase
MLGRSEDAAWRRNGGPVIVREQVPLAGYTTLGLGGPAARFAEAATDADVVSAVRDADRRGEPVLVLGSGSNLVIADEGFDGTAIRIATRGITEEPGGQDRPATVRVAAGEDWDGVVRWAIARGLSGLECLSGIPGLAGATPIQNVGAYGQEVSSTIVAVRGWDRRSGEEIELPRAGCGFGYRTSVFKEGSQAGRFVVLEVTFRLARDPRSAPVRYAELARVLGAGEGDRVPLADAREAVLRLRRGKGMVLDPADPDTRSAGSFFTNPVLAQAQFEQLESVVTAGTRIPRFPAPGGQVKVPAAWLIEQAGFTKGYPGPGGARPRISGKHTLALVNPGDATADSLVTLAREIRDGVLSRFGVELTAEPTLIGLKL